MKSLAAFLFCLIAALSAVAADTRFLDTPRDSINVPGGFREHQLPEFLRQLKLSAFIDMGPSWKDYDDAMDYFKPAVEPFHIQKCSVREALDQFCKPRQLIWEVNPLGTSVRILHKDASQRRASTVMAQAFKAPLSISGETPIARLSIVQEAWKKTAPAEFEVQVGHSNNVRGALLAANSPESMNDLCNQWLNSEPQVVIWLQEYTREGKAPLAFLDVQTTPLNLEQLSLNDLLHVFTNRASAASIASSNPKLARQYCINEFYRRFHASPEDARKAFLAAAKNIALEAVQPGSNLKYELYQTSIACYGSLLFQAFNGLDVDTQIKVIDGAILPEPADDNGAWVKEWEFLHQSTNAKVRDYAKSVLANYKDKEKSPTK